MTKLPKSLTRVTTFSKLIALFVFLAFIVSAFYAGMLFQKKAGDLTFTTPTPTPQLVSEQTQCQINTDCTLADINKTAACCPNARCLDLSKEDVSAVNLAWLQKYQKELCVKKICPMIMTICAKQITEENKRYSAKCINNICQKVRS